MSGIPFFVLLFLEKRLHLARTEDSALRKLRASASYSERGFRHFYYKRIVATVECVFVF